MNGTLWATIGSSILFGVSSGFSPGPLMFLVISETLRHGIRTGVLVAVTPLLTDLPILAVALMPLKQLTNFIMLLGLASFVGALFLIRIGWISLKTAGFEMKEEYAQPHSLGTRMMTNYLNPSMYLFWFTVRAPLVLPSSKVFLWPAMTFVVCFFASIIGSKIFLAFIANHSHGFLQGIWYCRIMQVLGLFLMSFALLFVQDGFTYLGVF